MAAELLAVLVPSVEGDAKAIALREVEVMKDKVLGAEPALVVQLSRAAGDKKLAIKAAKVCVFFSFLASNGLGCLCVLYECINPESPHTICMCVIVCACFLNIYHVLTSTCEFFFSCSALRGSGDEESGECLLLVAVEGGGDDERRCQNKLALFCR